MSVKRFGFWPSCGWQLLPGWWCRMPDNAEFMEELLKRPAPNPMRSALVAIQELHKPCKTFAGLEVCDVCNTDTGKPKKFPCPTRQLADRALGAGNE